ncbi:helix-turn-helix domain-containing protein [Sinimarinibacterium sp. NLF-5-8]|uniref:helix-turn-helix transcriptional regulator n=1 Tax=Sinimarinibacterium sp. NLF-5-8 TaxID=2698684 RepID=UPI00137B9622|nr:helix-turn-helix domain-containing protein [Sinimarinibacterium sp. NLF-5-8]QHS10320.1 helix-turn-helix domain-containing protein [Sinimarinibacterium sp. NLF-5-8]
MALNNATSPYTPARRTVRRTTMPRAASEPLLELQQVSDLIGAIYEGPTENPPWQHAVQMLREQLCATHVTLMLRPPSADTSAVMINTGPVTQQGIESYDSHFFAIDPFVGLPEGEVVTAEELIGSQWLKSAVYQEYLKPLDVRHLLGADIYTRDGIECRLRVTRSHADPAFTERDKALCKFILPHLKRSIQLHARLDSLESERSLFAGTVNRMLMGTLSYAQDGSLIKLNSEAQRILGEKDGLWLSGDTLCVESSQEGRDLQRMIRNALNSTHAAHTGDEGSAMVEAISISRPSGRAKLGVLIRSLPQSRWIDSLQRPAVVVFLRDPESNAVQPSQEQVQRLFGLTRMESQLAMLLTEGQTLDEAAETMGVRRNTARTHLRSIFCKTGVTRQTMLVRLLLNSVLSLS